MANGLLEQSIVYLGAAVVVVPVVKWLNFSAVLGYLIAGIVIGPFVLGLVGSSEKEQLAVMHFAEFGVVMMLFLIGLELRPALLWRLRGPIIGMGGLQVLLSAIAMGVVAYCLGLPLNQAIAVGMILALSSTAIVLQTLAEKGQLKTPIGQNIFSVLLFQDIAVIPMLAVMPLLADGNVSTEVNDSLIAGYPAWVQMLAVIASVLLIILMGRFVIRHFFRFIANTHIHELFTALTLFIVIGIAVLMQSVGLSPALGTFVAGVVLAESEYRHQLELDIEPFKGLLLGLFFMTVGAGIDFMLLWASLGLVLGLVFALIIVKFLVLLLIARLFKIDLRERMLFAFSLAQAGEFAFVLFAMAITLHVLPVQMVNLLVLIVALSMMLTPLLMILLEKGIMPYLQKPEEKETDTIENENNDVIIVGYGRFGQIVGRLLKANGINATILDFNADHVETVRKFGQKVYYGDATRLELLKNAGIESAKVVIIAIADKEKSLQLVKAIKGHYPHISIFVRAIGRDHAYDLIPYNVNFERETLLSALRLGERVLVRMGYHPNRAHRAAKVFEKHDHKVMMNLFPLQLENQKAYIESSKKSEAIIAETLRADASGDSGGEYSWSMVLSDEEAAQLASSEQAEPPV